MRILAIAAFAALLSVSGALRAQETKVTIDRGLTEDPPYTLIYPADMTSVDDGSPTTIATLRHANGGLQCDALVTDGAPSGWTAADALKSFDRVSTESAWAPDFPGFTITNQGLTHFQSGPALLYDGKSTASPLGMPVSVVHAEAVDTGRTYIFECVVATDIATEARPLIDFLIANFSTRSNGECCVNPSAQ